MKFYMKLEANKELSHVPQIDSISLLINDIEGLYVWDETDACVDGKNIHYRFKGVSVQNGDEFVYVNNALKPRDAISIKEINWQEDDDAEIFDFSITSFFIDDNNGTGITVV